MNCAELIALLREYPVAMPTNITHVRAASADGPVLLISDPVPSLEAAAPAPKKPAAKPARKSAKK